MLTMALACLLVVLDAHLIISWTVFSIVPRKMFFSLQKLQAASIKVFQQFNLKVQQSSLFRTLVCKHS